MKRFSILIYCVAIVSVVSFGRYNTERRPFEWSLRERVDCVVNKPSISLVSARKRQTPQRFASVFGSFLTFMVNQNSGACRAASVALRHVSTRQAMFAPARLFVSLDYIPERKERLLVVKYRSYGYATHRRLVFASQHYIC